MSSTTRVSILVAALSVVLSSAGVARASGTFPPVLRDALEAEFQQSFCVPQCTACHLTTAGGPGMMNVFGANLEKYGGLGPVITSNVRPAIVKYFSAVVPADAPQTHDTHEFDSDSDGISDRAELLAGDSPSVAAPRGQGQFCPDIKYGCAGGRIAQAPPPLGRSNLLSAGLIVLGFASIRRRLRGRARKSARASVRFLTRF